MTAPAMLNEGFEVSHVEPLVETPTRFAPKLRRGLKAEMIMLRLKKEQDAEQNPKEMAFLDEQLQIVSTFLKQHGFDAEDVNAPKAGFCGLTKSTYPLHVAAKEDRLDVVLLLLQCGADPSKKDCFGRTVYSYVKSGHFAKQMRLVHLKASIDGGLPF